MARAVADVVLVRGEFAAVPAMVAEGRRILRNVQRVAKLFVTKSAFAAFLVLSIGLTPTAYPLLPRQLTLAASLTIGIPAFFLALAPNSDRSRPGFAGRVARFAIPAGAVAAGATFGGYAMAGSQPGVRLVEERTMAVIVLFLVGLWVLGILARPLSPWKVGLLAAVSAAFAVLLATPALREFFELSLPSVVVSLAGIGVAAIAIALLELGWQAIDWTRRRAAAREAVVPGGLPAGDEEDLSKVP
jgi:cation-transporting ATPase E